MHNTGVLATGLRRHIPHVALTWDDEAGVAKWRVIDGTLVFADISGFTALTERLSSRGRIGAEEIVETLNRVFGSMLDTAALRGADLLKFGGDALLFLFRGDGHATRACDAVIEMRSALRAAARVPTSVGKLKLSMSVGVHSGDVHLFLVGAPTRELLVLGPAATATARAEAAATAGEVVVTKGTADRLPAGSATERPDGLFLFTKRRPFAPAAHRPEDPPIARNRQGTLFPVDLGDYLDPGPPDAEHRVATIAFIRFSGTDALLAGPGPDAVAEAVGETVRMVEEAIALEGVTLLATDIDSDGGKFFLASGVPETGEDDEGRMLRALRRFVDAGSPLPVQVGINRGHVFVAEVGASNRAAYSAMGDTTNTAARIMSKAPVGTIFAHPDVLEHSRTLFAAEPAGPFAMKGKSVPLLVYDVGAEGETRSEEAQVRLPLVGRDDELAAVRAVLGQAAEGHGGVITVDGTTGMGKSRLVHEAADVFPQLRKVVVRAEPYGATSSYRVFRDPVRRLLGITRDAPEVMGKQMLATLAATAPELQPMAPLIADLAQVDVPNTPEAEAIDPQYRPDRLADVLVELVDRMLPGPVLLMAEEMHWADAASSQLLERIAAAALERPWALVVIRRGKTGGFITAVGSTVTLDPLPPHIVEQLVIEATQAAPLRPHEVAAIVENADGNPLFVEEVTRVARAAGSLESMPESLQGLMAAQIDLLDPVTRRILRYASALGRSFRRVVLDETLASDGLVLDEKTASKLDGFLQDDGPDRLKFRNSLVRNAAYEELAYRTRARLHRAAGLAVERLSADLEADAATLALHFSRAGIEDKAWRYGLLAGEAFRRAFANADAAAQYELALDSARHLPISQDERIDAWAVLADLRQLAGIMSGSIDAYRRAAELAKTDPVRQAEFMARRARIHSRASEYITALRLVARARRLLESINGEGADRIRVLLDTQTAVIRLGQEKPREAYDWALRAIDGARRVDDPESLVQALISLDHALLHMGKAVDGSNTREALAICRENGFRTRESIACANLGNFAFYAGQLDEALTWHEESRRVALEAGNAFGAAETDVNIGEILVYQNRMEEAESVLRGAVRVLRASGLDYGAAFGEMYLSRALLERGAFDEAEELVRPLVEQFTAFGTRMTAFEASLIRADIALRRGLPADCLLIVGEAEAASRGEGAPLRPRACQLRAEALLALADWDECAAAIDAGLVSARDQAMPMEEARLLRVRARLLEARGQVDEAAAEDRAAASIEEGLGARV